MQTVLYHPVLICRMQLQDCTKAVQSSGERSCTVWACMHSKQHQSSGATASAAAADAAWAWPARRRTVPCCELSGVFVPGCAGLQLGPVQWSSIRGVLHKHLWSSEPTLPAAGLERRRRAHLHRELLQHDHLHPAVARACTGGRGGDEAACLLRLCALSPGHARDPGGAARPHSFTIRVTLATSTLSSPV